MYVVNAPGVVRPVKVKRTTWLFVPGTTWAAAAAAPKELPLRSRFRSDACTVVGLTGLLKVRSSDVSGTATHSGAGEAETTFRAGTVRSSRISAARRVRRGRRRREAPAEARVRPRA